MVTGFLLLLAAGAAAGYLGGLLGIGGGLLVVAALSLVLPTLGFPHSVVMHVAIATSLTSIVFTFASSSLAHLRRGSIVWSSWMRLAPGMVLGAILGARLANNLPESALRWIVALFCGFMAWRMAFGKSRVTEGEDHVPRSPWLLLAGGGIGAFSAVLGIGGGSLTVPLLSSLGVRPVKAVGTSALCGLALTLAGTASYLLTTHATPVPLPEGTVGDVYLPAALITAAAAAAAAPWGVRTAHAISGTALKRVFAGFLVVVGALMVSGG